MLHGRARVCMTCQSDDSWYLSWRGKVFGENEWYVRGRRKSYVEKETGKRMASFNDRDEVVGSEVKIQGRSAYLSDEIL